MHGEDWAIRAILWVEDEGSWKAEDADTSDIYSDFFYNLALSGYIESDEHSIDPSGEVFLGTGGRLSAFQFIRN